MLSKHVKRQDGSMIESIWMQFLHNTCHQLDHHKKSHLINILKKMS